MSSMMCLIDDKYVPLYRVMWVASVPHFCGDDDCIREGEYEVRLEQDETIWANREERDRLLQSLEQWAGGLGSEQDEWQ